MGAVFFKCSCINKWFCTKFKSKSCSLHVNLENELFSMSSALIWQRYNLFTSHQYDKWIKNQSLIGMKLVAIWDYYRGYNIHCRTPDIWQIYFWSDIFWLTGQWVNVLCIDMFCHLTRPDNVQDIVKITTGMYHTGYKLIDSTVPGHIFICFIYTEHGWCINSPINTKSWKSVLNICWH